MRIVLVGDCHAVPEELDDCRALMRLVEKVASDNEAEVLFLGDQFHTHAVIRSEVMWFWRESFSKLLANGIKITALVGNHDFSGAYSQIHAMASCADLVSVVDRPVERGGVLLLPYTDDHEVFVKEARKSEKTTLICHQTFTGSKYENGMYAPDGLDPELIPQTTIISGHIHSPQVFGKVVYIGAPRWRTLSDANVERAIWLYDFNDDGSVLSKRSFDTGTACRKISYLVDTQENPIPVDDLDWTMDHRIDIRGDSAWVEARKALFSRPGVKVRVFRNDAPTSAVRESEGVAVAFSRYVKTYTPRFGTATETLEAMAKERLYV